ncbi:hypothetical protein [Terrabacter sp. NPDC000476]|uniref:hypothetical protein n=1 Tax=Terrabacter sp. NPDC000476 TaxID=3154258 RepID=UPI003326B158
MTLASPVTRGRAPSAHRRLAVPWVLVVPLAALFAAVDGFWAASMRSAVGAIERTGEPFVTWAHQTVVTLPLHVVALVAALTLAVRWFGPAPRGRRQLWTGALVALAGAAVGTLVLALGAVVDLRLQQGHVELMTHMTPGCGAPCLERIEADGVATAVRGVAWGSALVVVTDLALVAWVMAALGGRLPVTRRSRRSRRSRRADLRPRPGARTAGLAAALAGSAAIHLAVVPEHLDEWPLAGAFFVVLAAAEAVAAVAVLLVGRVTPPEPHRGALGVAEQRETRLQLRRGALGVAEQRETRLQLRRGALGVAEQREARLQLRRGALGAGDVRGRRVLVAVVLLGAGPLLVWLVSRTVGLPFGPGAGEVEAVGQADLAAVALELVTVWLAAGLLVRPASPTDPTDRWCPAHVRALAVTAVLAVTIAGCAGALPDLLGDVTGPATTITVPDHGHADGG